LDQRLAGDIAWSKSMARRAFRPKEGEGLKMASTSIVKLVSLNTWRIMRTDVRSLRLKFPSLLLHKGYYILGPSWMRRRRAQTEEERNGKQKCKESSQLEVSRSIENNTTNKLEKRLRKIM
jgi:hypothetical protein